MPPAPPMFSTDLLTEQLAHAIRHAREHVGWATRRERDDHRYRRVG
jgi:hypothetical protein